MNNNSDKSRAESSHLWKLELHGFSVWGLGFRVSWSFSVSCLALVTRVLRTGFYDVVLEDFSRSEQFYEGTSVPAWVKRNVIGALTLYWGFLVIIIV